MADSPVVGTVTYQNRMKFCNRPACGKGCRAGIPGHGPYWYASWREGGRVRSRYLGKQAPMEALAGGTRGQAPTSAAAAPRVPLLRVQTLGRFVIWRGAERVPVDSWGPRMYALFALLLESVDQPRTREQLADVLWPDLEPGAAMKALRQTLSRLRKVLDIAGQQHSYLPSRMERLTIDPAPKRRAPTLWWDVPTFRAAAAPALVGRDLAQGRAAIACYGGEYLPDEALPVVESQRSTLRDLYLTLLLHQARIAAGQAEMDEAEACLRLVLGLAPVHEEAGRMLMLLLEQSGRRTEAIKVHQDLVRAVDEELGIVPDAHTQRLAMALTDQAQRATTAPPTPIESSPELPGNLPHASDTFVGRQTARGHIAALLNEQRLVTLSGVGGIGKSTLARQIGHDLRERFPEGVWWVEFAGLPAAPRTDDPSPALLAPALVQSLGIEQGPNQSITTALETFLKSRRLLLILDNCEHVRVPVALLVSRLLGQCPKLHVLLTSRAQLDLAEETVWPVPPFKLPEYGADLQTLAATEAVQFFVTRVRAVRGSFRLEAATAGAVAQICRRLDGIPLALELAAARMRLLEVDELAARLDDRFRLLSGTNPLALPRHQTLRATLDWSYALLAEPEQVLLRRLAVFAGGWTLAAAETVGGDSALHAGSILDLLDLLVRHSLVLVDHHGPADDTRYHMLETVREYGLLQVAAAKEQTTIAAAHRRWCLSLALLAEPQLRGHEQTHWFERLEIEHENLQAALAWSCAEPHCDPGREGIELAAAIWQFWYMRSHYHVGRTWFERLFSIFPAEGTALWAKVLNAAGCLAISIDQRQARTLLEASLHAARQVNDRRGIARALANLASVCTEEPDVDVTLWYEECLTIFRELADRPNEATVLHMLGIEAKNRTEYPRARVLLEEALAHWQMLGNKLLQSNILDLLADIAGRSGELARAAQVLEEGLGMAREIEHLGGIANCLRTKARIVRAGGDYMQAVELLLGCLDIRYAAGITSSIAEILEDLASLVASSLVVSPSSVTCEETSTNNLPSDDAVLWAAQLLGAGDAIRVTYSTPVSRECRAEHEADVNCIQKRLGHAKFAVARSNGATLSPDDAVTVARQGSLLFAKMTTRG